jgi:putative ABC transport system permease protein
LTFGIVLPAERYPDAGSQVEFQRQFVEQLRGRPGIDAVGGVFPLPLTGMGLGSRYAPDLASFGDGSARQAQYRLTYPGYFESLSTPVIAGRTFRQADQDGARNVVVINRSLAERAWPDEPAVGKRLFIRRGDRPEAAAVEVVGVVDHHAVVDVDEEGPETVWFLTAFAGEIGFFTGVTWTARTAGDPMSIAPTAREVLASLDPNLAVVNVEPLQTVVDESMAQMRFSTTMIGLFALLALVLSVVGLYGVLAYRVRQRLPEIGVRLAFGAAPTRIFSLVVGQGMLLVGLGIAIGVAFALVAGRLLSGQLVGVGAADPLTYAAIVAIFAAVAIAACALPALRATRVDPAVSLRDD